MHSRLFLAAALAFAVAAPPIFCQQPAASPGREHHWPKPTNLQVLPKNTTPEQLHKIMHGISQSLGVHCSFCHVINEQTHHANFASDSKPDKNIARIMMRMTGTINAQYMSKVHDPDAKPEDTHVTCATCHRGHKMPPQFVPPPEHHGPPMAGRPASGF